MILEKRQWTSRISSLEIYNLVFSLTKYYQKVEIRRLERTKILLSEK